MCEGNHCLSCGVWIDYKRPDKCQACEKIEAVELENSHIHRSAIKLPPKDLSDVQAWDKISQRWAHFAVSRVRLWPTHFTHWRLIPPPPEDPT